MHGSDLDELVKEINAELKLIVSWLEVNRLSLNIGKTFYMVFTPKFNKTVRDLDIFIGTEKIDRVYQCKFVGVLLDDRFSS